MGVAQISATPLVFSQYAVCLSVLIEISCDVEAVFISDSGAGDRW
jgi:hypothetical protein